VDVNLNETESELCFVCREPLSVEEQKLESYKVNVSCPYCINKSKEEIQTELRQKDGKEK
jgi:predicted sulfurtransferase